MTVIQFVRARRTIAKIAKQQGISTAKCRADMIEAIQAAWATNDPQAKNRQIQLAGEGRVPTPEELILIISKEIT